MRKCEKVIAVIILACFLPVAGGDWLIAVHAASPPNPAAARQQVELFGVGAAVEVRLASGEKFKGSIGAIDADGFELVGRREGLPRPIAYAEVTELKAAKSTYRASDPPNPGEARGVAAGLGVGRHVAVKMTSGKVVRGHLQAFKETHFVLLLDRQGGPLEIPYGDVQSLGPNLSKGAKLAIAFASIAAVIAISWVVFSDHRGQ